MALRPSMLRSTRSCTQKLKMELWLALMGKTSSKVNWCRSPRVMWGSLSVLWATVRAWFSTSAGFKGRMRTATRTFSVSGPAVCWVAIVLTAVNHACTGQNKSCDTHTRARVFPLLFLLLFLLLYLTLLKQTRQLSDQ